MCNVMEDNICLCSLCKEPSFDHSKQDEEDAFIICENCEERRLLRKKRNLFNKECGVCYETNKFSIKLPKCEHLLCRDCCFRICFYDEIHTSNNYIISNIRNEIEIVANTLIDSMIYSGIYKKLSSKQ